MAEAPDAYEMILVKVDTKVPLPQGDERRQQLEDLGLLYEQPTKYGDKPGMCFGGYIWDNKNLIGKILKLPFIAQVRMPGVGPDAQLS